MTHNKTRPVDIKPGQIVEIEFPYSEVCIHLKIAGLVGHVELLAPAYPGHPYMAQLRDIEDRKISFPVTTGEAGIYRDEDGRYYTHTTQAEVKGAAV